MADPLTTSSLGSVPDPTDTTNADATAPGISASVSSFDEFTQFGINPNMQNINVPWTPIKTTTPVMADAPDGSGKQVPAYPARTQPGPDQKSLSYLKATQFLAGLNTGSPDQFRQIQLSLAAGGFMGKKPNVISGALDATTRKAWNEVLLEAIRTGKTPDDIIAGALSAVGGVDAGLARYGMTPNAANPIRLTHPDDIRAVAKQVSMKVLGKGWSGEQLDQFVRSYQGMEAQEGVAAQGVGGTYTAAPSVQSEAEAEARRQNPTAAGATDWDNAFQGITKAIQTLGGTGK